LRGRLRTPTANAVAGAWPAAALGAAPEVAGAAVLGAADGVAAAPWPQRT
jgi:hypothetical protein